ncbi:MAG: hypothetical protein KJ077_47630 [Anaerolineae bacterium]|nr:hypothetical protein [Anaerolineae bacterium]
MNAKLQKWLPHALCCLPGVVAVAIVGFGLVVGESAFGVSLGGPLGLGLVALALLACPLSMGLMMWRNQKTASGTSSGMTSCCAPDEALAALEAALPADRLAALRDRREALEREVAELQRQ